MSYVTELTANEMALIGQDRRSLDRRDGDSRERLLAATIRVRDRGIAFGKQAMLNRIRRELEVFGMVDAIAVITNMERP